MPTKITNTDNFEQINRSVLENLKEEDNSSFDNNKSKDFFNSDQQQSLSNLKKRKNISFAKLVSGIIIFFCVVIMIAGGSFVYNVMSIASETTGGGQGNIWSIIVNNFNPQAFQRVELKGEAEGRTNILVIGYDSVAFLADSIMILSYYHNEQKIATLSIPRDFYVTDGGGTYRINAIYPFAEKKQPGTGAQAMADFLSRELDIPIHYWLSVNFQGVKQIIDAIGGIEVNVTVPFTDYEFPTDNYSGYIRPAPTFEKGLQQMDGNRALIYARSRHGTNGTGSDFDRSRRQAEISSAILQKLQQQLRSGKILNINSINALIASARGNVKTSAEINEILSFYEIFKKNFNHNSNISDNFYSINFRSGNGFLCSPPLDLYGASVITYCDGALGGGKSFSKGREQARKITKNLLAEARYVNLKNSNAIILANQSQKTVEVTEQIKKLPIGIVWPPDNFYKYIQKANGNEQIKIYIADDKIRQEFELASKGNLNFEFELHGQIPPDKFITANNLGADIIVWIE